MIMHIQAAKVLPSDKSNFNLQNAKEEVLGKKAFLNFWRIIKETAVSTVNLQRTDLARQM